MRARRAGLGHTAVAEEQKLAGTGGGGTLPGAWWVGRRKGSGE